MDVFFIKAAQLVLALMILIIIHEFGHFLFARIFGVKVEKFYIFFNPWVSIFKWHPKRYWGFFGSKKYFKNNPNALAEEKLMTVPVKDLNTPAEQKDIKAEQAREVAADEAPRSFWGSTEYGIGWLPLGGYCKIAGMIDESMDTEQMKQPAKEWEFRSKPAWQRLLIMIAGVLFNFLTAIVIYAGIVYATGEKYVNFDKATLGMAYSDEAKKIGFQDGDIPLEADGEKLTNPGEGRMKMVQAKVVKVLRNGSDTVSISIPKGFIFRLEEEMKKGDANVNFMAYRIPAQVSQVSPGGGADHAGMKVGDRVLAIDSVATPSLDQFFKVLDGKVDKTLKFTVLRNEKDTVMLPVKTNSDAKIGIGLETDPSTFFDAEVKRYNLFESVPRGIEMGVGQLTSYASSMKLVFTKEGAKSVGGFGTIGSIFPEKWNWIVFWNIAAFLSVALAFMNILPIPALDGGHVLFLIYEIITGRQPNQKFLEYAQMVGMFLLLALLLYANGMDIVRLFVK